MLKNVLAFFETKIIFLTEPLPHFKAIDYIRKTKQFSAASASINEQQTDNSRAGQMFSLGRAATQLLSSGIENLTVGKKSLPVTRLVDQIIDQKDTGSINVGYWGLWTNEDSFTKVHLK